MILRLGRHLYDENARLIMAIVNRTPDSFYDKGATWAADAAKDRVRQVVDEGADIVDLGGIKAAPGAEIAVRVRRGANLDRGVADAEAFVQRALGRGQVGKKRRPSSSGIPEARFVKYPHLTGSKERLQIDHGFFCPRRAVVREALRPYADAASRIQLLRIGANDALFCSESSLQSGDTSGDLFADDGEL